MFTISRCVQGIARCEAGASVNKTQVWAGGYLAPARRGLGPRKGKALGPEVVGRGRAVRFLAVERLCLR